MNRRQFIAAGGAAGLVAARGSVSAPGSAESAATPVLMKLGCQSAPTNDVHLRYLAMACETSADIRRSKVTVFMQA